MVWERIYLQNVCRSVLETGPLNGEKSIGEDEFYRR
jgi:hypothetical protein